MWIEKWDQMVARHDKERRDVLQSLSDQGYTQTEAAHILGKSLSFINSYARMYRVQWKVKRQGGKQHVTKN